MTLSWNWAGLSGGNKVDLTDYLEARLHHTVDLVIKRSLHPLIRDQILPEARYA
ncbi:MAG: hypothetical protein ABFC78_06290 [Methanoregula sp.]